MGLFSKSDNSFLGVDIGDSSLKMVELEKRGKKIYLSNYAFSENVSDVKFTKIDDTAYLAKAINKVRNEAKITAKKVTASLPTFAVFSSIITLAGVDKKNMTDAVLEEAKKVIPLPLEEMKIDFKVIPESGDDKTIKSNVRVFLTCSPRKIVRKYIDVFRQADLELSYLETETFSLVRSLIGNDKSTIMIVEIGANSTDISIVCESIPVLNRSLEICGTTITQALMEKLELTFAQAEQFKIDLSLSDKTELPAVIIKTIAPIISEIKYMLDFYNMSNPNQVEKIVLSGGSSLMSSLVGYLSDKLNIQVIIGDPFSRITYPDELKPIIREVGPRLAVAVGLALRDIES